MSKLLERLDELYLRKPTKRGELQYDRYQRLASALVDAYPKLRAVVEAAREVVRDPYTDEIEHLAGTLKALEEGEGE